MKLTCQLMVTWLFLSQAALARSQEEPISLERALIRQAPMVIKHLRDQGCENVGVLKFLITKDGKKLSDNVGAMNLLLARQFETALLVANDPTRPLGIIEDASAVAVKVAGASHLSREGRRKLFDAEYPLAWGNKRVAPDAFVTGTAAISPDLKAVTITLLLFTRKDNKLVPLGDDFMAAIRPNHLVDLGESYLLRGLVERGKVEIVQKGAHIIEQAHKTRLQEVKHPLQTAAEAPIRLQVLYDGEVVQPVFKDGKAYVPEPFENQKVALALKSEAGKGRFGVVLKVNGENTIRRQRLPDLHCRMWVLEPGEGPHKLAGYQLDDKQAEQFAVSSARVSKDREINYGADVGTITMTVFREASQKPKPTIDEAKVYEEIVEKVHRPKDRPENYNALKNQLLEDANRGIIEPGKTIGSETRTVTFIPDPNPVMTVTIVYYKKQTP